jgi:hypothetical protein
MLRTPGVPANSATSRSFSLAGRYERTDHRRGLRSCGNVRSRHRFSRSARAFRAQSPLAGAELPTALRPNTKRADAKGGMAWSSRTVPTWNWGVGGGGGGGLGRPRLCSVV